MSLEKILPGLKTVLPHAGFGIEVYVDPRELLRDGCPFGDHTGYYTLTSPRGIAGSFGRKIAHGVIPGGEPYPVFHVTAIRVAHATRVFGESPALPSTSAARPSPPAPLPSDWRGAGGEG